MTLREERPIDSIFPDRCEAIGENRCINPPIGCGKPINTFKDGISYREYQISGLCQECQDNIFTED